MPAYAEQLTLLSKISRNCWGTPPYRRRKDISAALKDSGGRSQMQYPLQKCDRAKAVMYDRIQYVSDNVLHHKPTTLNANAIS